MSGVHLIWYLDNLQTVLTYVMKYWWFINRVYCLQIPVTTTRILLNHFKWDKEKLMERFYDGDQEKLFSEAHVVSPFKATNKPQKASCYISFREWMFLIYFFTASKIDHNLYCCVTFGAILYILYCSLWGYRTVFLTVPVSNVHINCLLLLILYIHHRLLLRLQMEWRSATSAF